MRIIHAVYSMEMGGAEMLVAQLCRVQRAAGHDVQICAYSTLGVLGEELRREGFVVHVLGVAHPAKTMLRYWMLFLKLQPDVVHSHNPAPTLQAAAGARLAGVRCVLATRHSLVSPPYDRGEEMKFGVWSRWLDWVVGICEMTCENLRGAPLAEREKIVRVYNGVNPVVCAEKTGHEGVRLLFVGRLAEIKDLPTMVRAVAMAVQTAPEIALTIVGDGPVREGLEALVRELGVERHVRFEGQQMETERYFCEAHVFVMSSVSEGLPMSLLQAMSVGVPAVLTDVGGMREVGMLSGGALLSPVGDARAMADAMVRMAKDAPLRRVLGERAKAAYAEHFTLAQMAAAYERLYERA